MKAAIYTRISRDEAGQGLGVQRQFEDCSKLANEAGADSIDHFCDNDVSAYSGRVRPQYQALLEAIRQNRVDAVFAWAPERLHRSPTELEEFILLIEAHGVMVTTFKAGALDLSTSHGRMVARLFGAVSRAESERTAERVSRAHQQAKRRGYWRGPIPFGMRASSTPGLPEPDPEHAEVVREMAARVRRHEALTAIAGDLNQRGIRPRRGVAWAHSGVNRLLASPALGGLVRVDDELIDGAFDGLMTGAEWHETRAAIARRPRGERTRPPDKLTLLGGIMVCAEHGHACFGCAKDGKPAYGTNVLGECSIGIKRAPVDEFMREVVIQRLSRPDAADVLKATETTDPSQEIAVLQLRRDDLTVLLAKGLIQRSVAEPQLEEIKEQLWRLEGKAPKSNILEAALIDPVDAWERWNVPQRREAIRILFSEVSLAHSSSYQGPRVRLERVRLSWRA